MYACVHWESIIAWCRSRVPQMRLLWRKCIRWRRWANYQGGEGGQGGWFNKVEKVNLVLRWKRDKVECGKGVEKVEDLGGYWSVNARKNKDFKLAPYWIVEAPISCSLCQWHWHVPEIMQDMPVPDMRKRLQDLGKPTSAAVKIQRHLSSCNCTEVERTSKRLT